MTSQASQKVVLSEPVTHKCPLFDTKVTNQLSQSHQSSHILTCSELLRESKGYHEIIHPEVNLHNLQKNFTGPQRNVVSLANHETWP